VSETFAGFLRKFAAINHQMRLYGKRFFIGWIVSSIMMFGLSYVWHGIVLFDYEQIKYPLYIYFTAAAIAYFCIGFIVSRAFLLPSLDKVSRHPLLRGPAVGFAVGVLVYIIATAVHVTFNTDMDLKYLLLDITWQGIEQAFGGLMVGFIYIWVYEHYPVEETEE
jgi:hypothetical protein